MVTIEDAVTLLEHKANKWFDIEVDDPEFRYKKWYQKEFEVLDMSIKALQKQIPKKAIYEKDCDTRHTHKRTCPLCKDVVMISPDEIFNERYCRYCGNKLENNEDIR